MERPYHCFYHNFHYSRRQIRWLFKFEGHFRAGKWPAEPAEEYLTDKLIDDPRGTLDEKDKVRKVWSDWIGCGTTFEDRQGKPPARAEGAFCKPLEIYTDVVNRIEACGKDGRLLLAQLRAEYDYLDREAADVLSYVSGAKAKVMKYQDWLKQRRYLDSKKATTKTR